MQLHWFSCTDAVALVQLHWFSCTDAVALVQLHLCSCIGAVALVQLHWCSCTGAVALVHPHTGAPPHWCTPTLLTALWNVAVFPGWSAKGARHKTPRFLSLCTWVPAVAVLQIVSWIPATICIVSSRVVSYLLAP